MRTPLTLLFLFVSLITFSQETTKVENTINNQFDEIYRISSSYQTYKVISKERYQKLKQNVLDSIKSSKRLISEKERLLVTEKNSINETKLLLDKTKKELDSSLKKENSISVLGIHLNKSTYNLILWGVITILIIALFYFIFKFSRSNVLTKEAQNSLIDVEQDFETHRKKSLEREQKLRRQLQDEINKQRNS